MKVEYIAANGFKPSTAMPAANVIACCSAIPTSNVRLGNLLPNLSNPVPPGMAAVMAHTDLKKEKRTQEKGRQRSGGSGDGGGGGDELVRKKET